jgi:hypothetical protein
MYLLECDDEWNHIHSKDLWVYNKLFLSRRLGYLCGPAGTTVPKPDFYIVRPSFNLFGMSRLARIEWIEKRTDDMHPAEFWCEIFKGDHISVDYHHQEQDLCVLGTREEESPIYKWTKWEKINKNIIFPDILRNLNKHYEWINCEFIGEKLIEVQFRRNPNFRYNNKVAIPVWIENEKDLNEKYKNYKFIEDVSYDRIGFLIE